MDNNILLILNFILLSFIIKFSICDKNIIPFILYDPITNKELLPSIEKLSKLNLPDITSDFPIHRVGQLCRCEQFECGCCAGINIKQFNFDQKVCANLSLDTTEYAVALNMYLNQNNFFLFELSARNPPPICIPLQTPIPSTICIKLFDIHIIDRNVHFCMDWLIKVLNYQIAALHFNCFRIGFDGIQFLPTENPNQTETSIGDTTIIEQIDANVFDEVNPDRFKFFKDFYEYLHKPL